jgi:hypothetical protein
MATSTAALSRRLNKLLRNKVVKKARYRKKEVFIEFTDGTRLFVDALAEGLDCSVTGGDEDE